MINSNSINDPNISLVVENGNIVEKDSEGNVISSLSLYPNLVALYTTNTNDFGPISMTSDENYWFIGKVVGPIPGPFADASSFGLASESADNIFIHQLNANGMEVNSSLIKTLAYNTEVNLNKGQSETRLNVADLTPGMYFILSPNELNIETPLRFVKHN